jgi:anthranilate synthase/aminodeoxychorismate synthase-like glutamine amidotransferase
VILIIDNYDSFTYNLARYFEELGHAVKVIKNDSHSIDEIANIDFSHLVLSPGPCTPNESGICLPAIKRFANKVPILGVCLGHQAIAQAYGAKVIRAEHIRHGKTSLITIEDKRSVLFDSCPSSFVVTRYHSLLVDETTLSKNFKVTGVCHTQGVREVMAIEDISLKLYGLQFHPESLLTENGHLVLSNFISKG